MSTNVHESDMALGGTASRSSSRLKLAIKRKPKISQRSQRALASSNSSIRSTDADRTVEITEVDEDADGSSKESDGRLASRLLGRGLKESTNPLTCDFSDTVEL